MYPKATSCRSFRCFDTSTQPKYSFEAVTALHPDADTCLQAVKVLSFWRRGPSYLLNSHVHPVTCDAPRWCAAPTTLPDHGGSFRLPSLRPACSSRSSAYRYPRHTSQCLRTRHQSASWWSPSRHREIPVRGRLCPCLSRAAPQANRGR